MGEHIDVDGPVLEALNGGGELSRKLGIEFTELAARSFQLGTGLESLDTNHNRSGQQRQRAGQGKRGDFRTGPIPYVG